MTTASAAKRATTPTKRSAKPEGKLSMSGGEAIARVINAFNGGPMFGMGGFQLLPFYEAVRKFDMPHYLINDEGNAVFLADAYAKVSGRVGLADATVGPGATNLVTGLAEALNAGSPIVCVVGDTHRDHSWKNMTQESRQIEVLRPVCKELLRVESIKRIPRVHAPRVRGRDDRAAGPGRRRRPRRRDARHMGVRSFRFRSQRDLRSRACAALPS